jgi:predicted alpha/beta hydrolase family esterase
MNAEAPPVLILPGLEDSGPRHWQTLWQALRPGLLRVEQQDWLRPRCADWVAALDAAVAAAGPRSIRRAASATGRSAWPSSTA